VLPPQNSENLWKWILQTLRCEECLLRTTSIRTWEGPLSLCIHLSNFTNKGGKSSASHCYNNLKDERFILAQILEVSVHGWLAHCFWACDSVGSTQKSKPSPHVQKWKREEENTEVSYPLSWWKPFTRPHLPIGHRLGST
jgi:hypothetical protein